MVVQFGHLACREAGRCVMWCHVGPLLLPLGNRLMQEAFRLAFSHCFPKAAAILVDLVVAGVQDIFAAHAAFVHFTLFQGGTILVHPTGFVAIALCYQLVALVTYDG